MNALEHFLLTLTAVATLAGSGTAQTAEYRATFTGGGSRDTGKCTIEVQVDGSADVEIRGDRGLLRTQSGRTAQWRRFVCSGPMPANPADFRFIGIDGRGRQELVRDPRNGGGVIIVRIQDPNGGMEGYTFDLVWRGEGSGAMPGGQPWGGRNRGGSPDDMAGACRDAVRAGAISQYGLRDINFRDLNGQGYPGRNDANTGYFEAVRNNSRVTYRFSCAMNPGNGRVQGTDIAEERGMGTADRSPGRHHGASACQSAAGQRIERDGYRNVEFGSMNGDNRRNSRLAGTASAQRGNNGRTFNF
ncbi:MAG: hypothetical protein NTY38_06165, partial [Acidobacteria bacterium]|nr:hypothetical protein [Acidobacteriota bacterium]